MIKPSDIPCDFAEIAEELFKEGYWSHAEKHYAAEFLNAAIEAGLVVPASEVKVLRRALELTTRFISTVDEEYDTSPEPWIEQARRELESEGTSDQA